MRPTYREGVLSVRRGCDNSRLRALGAAIQGGVGATAGSESHKRGNGQRLAGRSSGTNLRRNQEDRTCRDGRSRRGIWRANLAPDAAVSTEHRQNIKIRESQEAFLVVEVHSSLCGINLVPVILKLVIRRRRPIAVINCRASRIISDHTILDGAGHIGSKRAPRTGHKSRTTSWSSEPVIRESASTNIKLSAIKQREGTAQDATLIADKLGGCDIDLTSVDKLKAATVMCRAAILDQAVVRSQRHEVDRHGAAGAVAAVGSRQISEDDPFQTYCRAIRVGRSVLWHSHTIIRMLVARGEDAAALPRARHAAARPLDQRIGHREFCRGTIDRSSRGALIRVVVGEDNDRAAKAVRTASAGGLIVLENATLNFRVRAIAAESASLLRRIIREAAVIKTRSGLVFHHDGAAGAGAGGGGAGRILHSYVTGEKAITHYQVHQRICIRPDNVDRTADVTSLVVLEPAVVDEHRGRVPVNGAAG